MLTARDCRFECSGEIGTGVRPCTCASRDRRCRAPPSHGDVLGPGRVDGTLGAHGPGGPARGHFGVSEMRRRDRGAASAASSPNTWATAC